MDYEDKKKVLELRKLIFSEFFEQQKIDDDYLSDDKIVSIDSIIAILSTFDIIIEKVRSEVLEKDEMLFYEVEEINSLKDKVLKTAKQLKKEILFNFYDSNYNNSEEEIAVDIDDSKEFNLKYTTNLRGKIMTISKESHNLKKLLEEEDFTTQTLDNLILNIDNLYGKMEELYGDLEIVDKYGVQFTDEDLISDDEINNDNDFLFDEDDSSNDYVDDYFDEIEKLDEKWKNTSVFNYDLSVIDAISILVFGEVEYPQRVLIGLLLADFYEYHKVNKLFSFKQEENKDVIDTINFIENSSLDENIERFLEEPVWADYILDSYIHYNVNSTPDDKLANRMAVLELGKIDVLKRYNPYIDDSLKDETLYNMFITPISELIRETNYSLSIDMECNCGENVDIMLVKYFTTDFLPYNDSYIPEILKAAKISDLKKLQLKFIISDFLKRNIKSDDDFINGMLNMNENELYNYVINNEYVLRGIIKEYICNMYTNDRTILDEEEKKKIIKINKLAALDV